MHIVPGIAALGLWPEACSCTRPKDGRPKAQRTRSHIGCPCVPALCTNRPSHWAVRRSRRPNKATRLPVDVVAGGCAFLRPAGVRLAFIRKRLNAQRGKAQVGICPTALRGLPLKGAGVV